jgi:hypothetical protein
LKVFLTLYFTLLKLALASTAILLTAADSNSSNYALTDLRTDLGDQNSTIPINNLEQIVDHTPKNGNTQVALNNDTLVADLDMLGYVSNFETSINNSDQLKHSNLATTGIKHATLWNSTTTALLSTLGSANIVAVDVNNVAEATAVATLLNSNIATQLNTNNLSNCSPFCVNSAKNVNDSSEAAGEKNQTAQTDNSNTKKSYFANDLSAASEINNLSQLVKDYSDNSINSVNPLGAISLADIDGLLPNLSSLPNFNLPGLTSAKEVKDIGEKVAATINKAINTSAGYDPQLTTASEVPLPAATWLFASGLGAFGVSRRRNKN